MSDVPVAVWSGEIMGVKVHVLDDGRRIIDAEDMMGLFLGDRLGDIDLEEFGRRFKEWADGGAAPSGSTGNHE